MKNLFAAFLILSYAFSAQAFSFLGGDDVGNGGGLAEKNFLIAAQNLESYSQLCLSLDACRLDMTEREVLAAIVYSMPQQRLGKSQIQFRSEKQEPGFFILNGEPKVAKTGSRVGDPIYINTDMIYAKNGFGTIEALSIPDALAILLHEYGHHVSRLSHSELDLLGVKVSLFLKNRIQHTPVLPWNQQVSVTMIQAQHLQSFPQVLLNIGPEIWNLSEMVKHSVFCPVFNIPIPILPFPDLQLGRQKPLGVYLHNLHWTSAARESATGDFSSRANLTHVCPSGTGFLTGVNSFRLRIEFSVERGSRGELKLKEKSVKVNQDYEPWYKLIQLPRL